MNIYGIQSDLMKKSPETLIWRCNLGSSLRNLEKLLLSRLEETNSTFFDQVYLQYIGWSLIEGHVQNMYGNRGYGAFIKAELQPTEVDPFFKK